MAGGHGYNQWRSKGASPATGVRTDRPSGPHLSLSRAAVGTRA
jgi:hypothetical protein